MGNNTEILNGNIIKKIIEEERVDKITGGSWFAIWVSNNVPLFEMELYLQEISGRLKDACFDKGIFKSQGYHSITKLNRQEILEPKTYKTLIFQPKSYSVWAEEICIK